MAASMLKLGWWENRPPLWERLAAWPFPPLLGLACVSSVLERLLLAPAGINLPALLVVPARLPLVPAPPPAAGAPNIVAPSKCPAAVR